MENLNNSTNLRDFAHTGRQLLLPPKSTFTCIFPPNANCIPSSIIRPEGFPKPKRTSSDSFLVEELLDEPETTMHHGHRRSSSDSIAYGNDGHKSRNVPAGPSRGSPNFDHHKDLTHASFHTNPRTSSLTSVTCSSTLSSTSDGISFHTSGSSCNPQAPDGVPSKAIVKQDGEEPEVSSLGDDCHHPNPFVLRTASKRAKQQIAQRSRVKKLQHIAELERNLQVLQAEGSEVSAELEFLDQQNLILGMENRALKQQLENLSQEHFIKHLEQNVLEKEIARLRSIYQQQQQTAAAEAFYSSSNHK